MLEAKNGAEVVWKVGLLFTHKVATVSTRPTNFPKSVHGTGVKIILHVTLMMVQIPNVFCD